jgi:orotate phosphoribosyltransferase
MCYFSKMENMRSFDERNESLLFIIQNLSDLLKADYSHPEYCSKSHRDSLKSALDAMIKVHNDINQHLPPMGLKDIIKQKSFRRGNFTLASGKSSDYFFDLKPTMLDPFGSNLIAGAVMARINMLYQLGVIHRVDAIGGMATGGIPIVSVISALSHLKGIGQSVFFVRKATKDHGTEKLIEGTLEPGSTVVLVEDVTTTGDSIMQAVRAVRAAGCHVYHVITIVDRLEGALENLCMEGIELHPIFVRTDFDE